MVVVPSPNSPALLLPHVQTVPVPAPVPSSLSATEKAAPAVIAVTPVSPTTWTGKKRFSWVPSPSCPEVFWPHAQTVWSGRTASEWLSPAAITVTFVSRPVPAASFTATGLNFVVVSWGPWPSCPNEPIPNAHTFPALKASEWTVAVTCTPFSIFPRWNSGLQGQQVGLRLAKHGLRQSVKGLGSRWSLKRLVSPPIQAK